MGRVWGADSSSFLTKIKAKVDISCVMRSCHHQNLPEQVLVEAEYTSYTRLHTQGSRHDTQDQGGTAPQDLIITSQAPGTSLLPPGQNSFHPIPAYPIWYKNNTFIIYFHSADQNKNQKSNTMNSSPLPPQSQSPSPCASSYDCECNPQRVMTSRSSRIRLRRRRRTMTPTSAFLFFSMACKHASAFAPAVTTASAAAAIPDIAITKRNFRHADESENDHPLSTSDLDNFFSMSPSPSEAATLELEAPESIESFSADHPWQRNEGMPSWLRPNSSLAEKKLSTLLDTMIDTYLSPKDAYKVVNAIREAAFGDRSKIAGAADFVLLIVETMEMGTSALIAAAVHYCACYNVRQEVSLRPSLDFVSAWDEYTYSYGAGGAAMKESNYNETTLHILKDVNRLKRTEMVASSLIHKSEVKHDKRETIRDSINMRKMLLSESKSWQALAIRAAACLYRLTEINKTLPMDNETTNSTPPHLLTPEQVRVAREALHMHAPLASRLGMHRLKNEIETKAFRILYPRQYRAVTSMTCQQKDREALKDSMSRIQNNVAKELTFLLENDPDLAKYALTPRVTSRIKEPFSLWRKMLKNKTRNILDIPDVLAFRVLLDAKKMKPKENVAVTRAADKALCYHSQQVCTRRFQPLNDGRFKDYIAHPKPNGYQSLHYTACINTGDDILPFEIQIRSSFMHQVAEFGLAAHWGYKENRNQSPQKHFAFEPEESSDNYLRCLQDFHWEHAQGTTLPKPSNPSNAIRVKGSDDEKKERVRARDEHLAPYLQALMKTKSNLTREQVFIFLESQNSSASSEGQILALPAGSCVLDAVIAGDRSLGVNLYSSFDSFGNIAHNGQTSEWNQKLNNGDIITIPPSARK